MNEFSLSDELHSKSAIVVHFSHHGKMREGGVFPDDLVAAINNHCDWTLSCCVLWPGHLMDLPGSVGVIFKPIENNVISVSPSDSGSSSSHDGTDQSFGLPLSPETFEQTFHPNINSYNEWRIRGGEVAGLFISDVRNIWVKQRINLVAGSSEFSEIGATQVTLDYVRQCFPDMEFFTYGASGLMRIPRSSDST